nr:uncharacterized protein LOC119179533 isoform X2 [Rhipicephalus microplus]
MDHVRLAVLITSMLSSLIYCQIAHDFSELPEKVRFMLGNTTKLLNSTERLVLSYGLGGPMRDYRLCWTSQKNENTSLGIHHEIHFMTNETAPGSNFTEVRLQSVYYVAPQNKTPTVLLRVHGGLAATELDDDYALLAGNPNCFVMGVTRQTPTKHQKKCLFWMRESAPWRECQECDQAFYDNCSSLVGVFYSVRKYWNNCNFSRPHHHSAI